MLQQQCYIKLLMQWESLESYLEQLQLPVEENLLIENKIAMYLKYAIGAIKLVVMGILVALQINNWNEERKLHNEINTYLNQKHENL